MINEVFINNLLTDVRVGNIFCGWILFGKGTLVATLIFAVTERFSSHVRFLEGCWNICSSSKHEIDVYENGA